ncbi:MAG: hypothetical protein HY308_13155 [Gammaproteobacteria bacterium]|nr:hypothetical protein [Gammaproteobacteria bacterium]
MRIVHWQTSITADRPRALDRRYLNIGKDGLKLKVEEESGATWILEFKSIQAWKFTSTECAATIVAALPAHGALFVVEQSSWVAELGESDVLKKAKHFVIGCRDGILEVLAWECRITSGVNELVDEWTAVG